MNDWPSALEYGEDLPAHPRELRVWLFRAYRQRLEWLACHHREELVSRIRCELTVSRWIFFPPGRTHRLAHRIRREEVAALAAATWVLARDTGFLVEERILFARLCRWAQRMARVDTEYFDRVDEEKGRRRLEWTPVTRKQRGSFRPGKDQKNET